MRWYLSAAAVKQFMTLCGLPPVEDGPLFDAAERDLADTCAAARLVHHYDDGRGDEYRAKTLVRGKVLRLELTVVTRPRPEGPLPQLVRVRSKGGNRTGHR